MTLGSVLQTALSAIAAAETSVALVADNLANAQTPGYKAARPILANQQPQTLSYGAAPGGANGGRNPVQIGTGVAVAGISADWSQGPVAIEGDEAGLAIDGEGLFILEGARGERYYARDGDFRLNADGELVTAGGDRVLGFAADDHFQIQNGRLSRLRIGLGRIAATPSGEAATLTGFRIGRDGRIQGSFTDGRFRDLGQIRLARFANPSGLVREAGNRFTAGPNSGLAVESNPSAGGVGQLVPGATELSNTDIAESLVDLQLASNLYRANLQVVDTSFQLLDVLMQLGRAAG